MNDAPIPENRVAEAHALLAEGRAALALINKLGTGQAENAKAQQIGKTIMAKMSGFDGYAQVAREVREFKLAQPFHPFVIITKDDRVMRVPTAEHIAFSPNGSMIVVFTGYGTAEIISAHEIDHASSWHTS